MAETTTESQLPALTADAIRAHVVEAWVEPARRDGAATIQVRVGDVLRALPAISGASHVCAALRSKALFQQPHGLRLVEQSGPRVGHNTLLTFANVEGAGGATSDAPRKDVTAAEALMALYGAGRDSYRAHGGGAAVLARVREGWS